MDRLFSLGPEYNISALRLGSKCQTLTLLCRIRLHLLDLYPEMKWKVYATSLSGFLSLCMYLPTNLFATGCMRLKYRWCESRFFLLLGWLPNQAGVPNYSLIAEWRTDGFIPFQRTLAWSETQTASSWIWTRVGVSIFYHNIQVLVFALDSTRKPTGLQLAIPASELYLFIA